MHRTMQRATTIPAGQVRRGRILLLLADEVSITDIAAVVGSSRRFVYKWAQRFLEERLEGLVSQQGWRHRRGPYPPDQTEPSEQDTS